MRANTFLWGQIESILKEDREEKNVKERHRMCLNPIFHPYKTTSPLSLELEIVVTASSDIIYLLGTFVIKYSGLFVIVLILIECKLDHFVIELGISILKGIWTKKS